MENWRRVVGVLLMSVMVIMGMMMSSAEAAKNIGYGVLNPDQGLGCSPAHPNRCGKPVENPYNRGCEKGERCRSGDP